MLWHGPSGHYFYGFLDRLLPGTSMKIVFQKVGIDQVRLAASRFARARPAAPSTARFSPPFPQIAWNPIFGIVFFTSIGLMEGKNSDQIQDKIKADLPTAVTGSWAYWVPAHFVNFRFIPGEQRLLYINGAAAEPPRPREPPVTPPRSQACRSCTTSSSPSSPTSPSRKRPRRSRTRRAAPSPESKQEQDPESRPFPAECPNSNVCVVKANAGFCRRGAGSLRRPAGGPRRCALFLEPPPLGRCCDLARSADIKAIRAPLCV